MVGRLDVVVVGGGPAGLLHAVGAALHGHARQLALQGSLRSPPMRIVVLEQRLQYSRDTWFDLTPASLDPSSLTLATLDAWGLRALRNATALRLQQHPGVEVLSVRCAVLERFLRRVLLALGGEAAGGNGGEDDWGSSGWRRRGTRSARRTRRGRGC